MRKFYLLLMGIFILSIFTTAPLNSMVENSENISEKVLEEKNFEEDKDNKFIDKENSYTITYNILNEIPPFIQTTKTSLYLNTHFRPPILL